MKSMRKKRYRKHASRHVIFACLFLNPLIFKHWFVFVFYFPVYAYYDTYEHLKLNMLSITSQGQSFHHQNRDMNGQWLYENPRSYT